MSISNWITAHSQGWFIFLAASTLLAGLAADARASGHGKRIPWLFLVVWLAAIGAFYFYAHMEGVRKHAPHTWSAMLVAVGVAVGASLLLVLLALAIWNRGRTAGPWASGAVIAAAIGTMGMVLAPTLALWVHSALSTWIALDRR